MTEVSTARLHREWALCSLAAAGSRFVPVPLVDDVIKERALRVAVTRTWRAHGRPDRPDVVDVLCDDAHGFWHEVGGYAARLPVAVVTFPVRKTVRIVTAARGVGRDAAQVLLLARAVDRCLRAGWFCADDDAELRHQARLVRQAHDRTVSSADLHVVEHGLRVALRQVGGWREQSADLARRLSRRSRPGGAVVDAGDELAKPVPEGIEQGAREVEAALERPDVVGVLSALDARFDAALRELSAAATPGPRP